MASIISGARRDLTVNAHTCQDPRTPWYAKLVAARCVGHGLNPIQLIPDRIPVHGPFADMLVTSLGVALLVRLAPKNVVRQCRAQARSATKRELATLARTQVTAVVIGPWLLVICVRGFALRRMIRR